MILQNLPSNTKFKTVLAIAGFVAIVFTIVEKHYSIRKLKEEYKKL
jgi:hypothetical protein